MDKSIAVVPLDVHKRFSLAAPLSGAAEVVAEVRLEHGDLEQLVTYLGGLAPGTPVVLEATLNWPWLVDLVEAVGLQPHLADPRQARKLRTGLAKSDRRDAVWLGRLWLAGDLFPEVYLAPPEVRRMRDRFRQRLLLVQLRTRQKNNVHGQLLKLGILADGQVADIFSPKGRRWLAQLPLDAHQRSLLDAKLAVIADLDRHIAALEQQIRQELEHDPRAPILMSIPGVGQLTAYTLLAEIGDLGRFPNGRALAAYAGVLPRDNESADKDFGKRTDRRCNTFLRWAAIEAATGAVRGSRRLRSLHARVQQRHKQQPGKARIAVARELLELVHLLLTRGQRYQEDPPPRPGSDRRRDRRTPPASPDPNRASQMRLSARPPARDARG
jgi:transposase